jgi:drug/metabolite transporter (DMT)-like permease
MDLFYTTSTNFMNAGKSFFYQSVAIIRHICNPEITIVSRMLSSTFPVSDVRRSNVLGLVAILFWSTTIAFSRSLTEQLGTLTAAALIYTLAGLIGLLYTSLQPGVISKLRQLPVVYVLGCGALFVAYIAALYIAVGLSATRGQVLVVGLINYLWPGLSLVFSIPVLGNRARPLLPVGIIMALAGIWLATTGNDALAPQALFQDQRTLLPYGLALFAAICWGLYSNLSRRWAGNNDGGAVPLFLLTSGLFLGVFRLFSPETSHWSLQAGLELAYMAVLPGMLAYILWDIAVRKGEIILVASLSYLTPMLSTLFSTLILHVQPGITLWLGAGLVIGGAVLCKASIVERNKEGK